MTQLAHDLQEQFHGALDSAANSDAVLTQFLEEHTTISDEERARLIEVDGRWRLERGRDATLERYLDLIESPEASPVSVDSAIDMALRSLEQSSGRSTPENIESLVSQHPELREQILLASELGLALWSTTGGGGARAAGSPLAVPSSFGPPLADGRLRYQLLRIAGSGSWAHTYVAVDRHFDDPDAPALVAIKVLARTAVSNRDRGRLANEATKARRVDHPNVVRALEHGVDETGRPFVVFEFAPGGDLARLLQESGGSVSPKRAARLVAKIALGAQAIHARGLVHLDLKPSNVVLDDSGEPKIVDLGIAQRTRDPESGDSAPVGAPATGTPAFMAPEQFRAEETASDPSADVYAIGHLLYWLITGSLANGQTPSELAENLGDPEKPRIISLPESIPGVDRELKMILSRAMAWQPGDRYFAPGELAQDLQRWARHEPIPWTRPGAARRVGLWARRRPVTVTISSFLFVVAGAGVTLGTTFKLDSMKAAQDLAVERAKLQAKEEADQKNVETIQTLMQYIKKQDWDGQLGQNLWLIWLAEWFYGPQVVGTPEQLVTFRVEKASFAAEHIQNLIERGYADSLERHLWETIRSFWLVEGGMLDDASNTLATTRAFWNETLAPADPWSIFLDTIDEVIRADRILAAEQFAPEEARLCAADLEFLLQQLYGLGDEKPLVSFIHKRLRLLYDEPLLDDPEKLAALDTSRELPPNRLVDK